MKHIKQHILEKLKITNISSERYFEFLCNDIFEKAKQFINNKDDFSEFARHLRTYFSSCCSSQSIKYSLSKNVKKADENIIYFHEFYRQNQFSLHYKGVTFWVEYKYSKLKSEIINNPNYTDTCAWLKYGYTSEIYEFNDIILDTFVDNFNNFNI